MASPSKNVTTADSGGEDPIIIKDSGGEDPIIIKDSGGEDPIIIKDSSSADDPIIIKGAGLGEIPSVNILLSSADVLGWTIAEAGDVITVIVPKTAPWQILTDLTTGKVYLKRADATISKMKVDDMVDAINPTIDAPPIQAAKRGNDPEIEIYFSPI